MRRRSKAESLRCLAPWQGRQRESLPPDPRRILGQQPVFRRLQPRQSGRHRSAFLTQGPVSYTHLDVYKRQAQDHAAVEYFPSYEIIAAPPTRGAFFEPNLRGIAAEGVELVMRHFFAGIDLTAPPTGRKSAEYAARKQADQRKTAQEDLVCEEMILERFNEA